MFFSVRAPYWYLSWHLCEALNFLRSSHYHLLKIQNSQRERNTKFQINLLKTEMVSCRLVRNFIEIDGTILFPHTQF